MIFQRTVTYIIKHNPATGETWNDEVVYTWWFLGIIPLVRIHESYAVAMQKTRAEQEKASR